MMFHSSSMPPPVVRTGAGGGAAEHGTNSGPIAKRSEQVDALGSNERFGTVAGALGPCAVNATQFLPFQDLPVIPGVDWWSSACSSRSSSRIKLSIGDEGSREDLSLWCCCCDEDFAEEYVLMHSSFRTALSGNLAACSGRYPDVFRFQWQSKSARSERLDDSEGGDVSGASHEPRFPIASATGPTVQSRPVASYAASSAPFAPKTTALPAWSISGDRNHSVCFSTEISNDRVLQVHEHDDKLVLDVCSAARVLEGSATDCSLFCAPTLALSPPSVIDTSTSALEPFSLTSLKGGCKSLGIDLGQESAPPVLVLARVEFVVTLLIAAAVAFSVSVWLFLRRRALRVARVARVPLQRVEQAFLQKHDDMKEFSMAFYSEAVVPAELLSPAVNPLASFKTATPFSLAKTAQGNTTEQQNSRLLLSSSGHCSVTRMAQGIVSASTSSFIDSQMTELSWSEQWRLNGVPHDYRTDATRASRNLGDAMDSAAGDELEDGRMSHDDDDNDECEPSATVELFLRSSSMLATPIAAGPLLADVSVHCSSSGRFVFSGNPLLRGSSQARLAELGESSSLLTSSMRLDDDFDHADIDKESSVVDSHRLSTARWNRAVQSSKPKLRWLNRHALGGHPLPIRGTFLSAVSSSPIPQWYQQYRAAALRPRAFEFRTVQAAEIVEDAPGSAKEDCSLEAAAAYAVTDIALGYVFEASSAVGRVLAGADSVVELPPGQGVLPHSITPPRPPSVVKPGTPSSHHGGPCILQPPVREPQPTVLPPSEAAAPFAALFSSSAPSQAAAASVSGPATSSAPSQAASALISAPAAREPPVSTAVRTTRVSTSALQAVLAQRVAIRAAEVSSFSVSAALPTEPMSRSPLPISARSRPSESVSMAHTATSLSMADLGGVAFEQALKFARMLKMGVPVPACRLKMATDGLPPSTIDVICNRWLEVLSQAEASASANAPLPHPESATSSPPPALLVVGTTVNKCEAAPSLSDEFSALSPPSGPVEVPGASLEQVQKFARMLKMGVPEPACRLKMTTDGVQQAAIDVICKRWAQLLSPSIDASATVASPVASAAQPSISRAAHTPASSSAAPASQLSASLEEMRAIPLDRSDAFTKAHSSDTSRRPVDSWRAKEQMLQLFIQRTSEGALAVEGDNSTSTASPAESSKQARGRVQSPFLATDVARKEAGDSGASSQRAKKQVLLDPRRSQIRGIGIMRHFKGFPAAALAQCLEDCLPSVSWTGRDGDSTRLILSKDQAAALWRDLLPESAELHELQKFSGDPSTLAEAESFYFYLKDIDNLPLRSQALAFRTSFESRIAECSMRLDLMMAACAAIRDSLRLPRILAGLSALMTASTSSSETSSSSDRDSRQASADTEVHSLTTLLMLKPAAPAPSSKAAASRVTPLQLLVEHLLHKDADAVQIDAAGDLASPVATAAGAEIDGLQGELRALERELEISRRVLLLSTSSVQPLHHAGSTDSLSADAPFGLFIGAAELRMAEVRSAYREMSDAFAATIPASEHGDKVEQLRRNPHVLLYTFHADFVTEFLKTRNSVLSRNASKARTFQQRPRAARG